VVRLALLLTLVASSASAETVLRIATLAPEGSSFARVIEASADRIAERTDGRVRVRIFWSGQLGDERDMVRRMRLGSLDGATLATAGIGLVAREALVLQLPRLFGSTAELERALDTLAPELDAAAEASGFVVVAWSDLGAVHLVSRTPPRLAGLRAWIFGDEPFLRDLLLRLGARGTPLGVGEVAPALAAGTVDAAYGPLLAAVMLGWTPYVRFALDEPLAHAIAALVVSRAAWEQLSPEDRLHVREVGAETAAELRALARRDEARARRVLERQGVVFLAVPAAERARLDAEARAVAEAHAPPALLERIRAATRPRPGGAGTPPAPRTDRRDRAGLPAPGAP
jgi:TRAP-type C4-dicarboxylate transport system substrate-binding protein